ncbi:ABC transporter ATP-binding protein [Caldimonas brevitalea]|uniref:Sugar ABC transporter ATP-binding protein n=1 Tax=Caldimonas brevitalea TaxID=413882 RepID=A0A0G3BPH8_9BURK|nr:sn-glycerol-3-phosphate ABC transporter ATP-binding protein UgpC [Caldimonas brevitalea]AKJ28480.1 sugar ABC transporter ATP-binding protein [Caldimonas brevitalea]
MAGLKLRGIKKQYAEGPIVMQHVDLDIRDGEFIVFVGPSGCGKSTLLRMIAGLEEITDGELYLGDELANDVPPAERGAAMVFQSYALYPHMTVAENMGFALKLAGQSKQQVKGAVDKAAEILQITHLLDRKPKALSGGQRQRVAIGRAIVRKPKVFLFDEPLSNLDAGLRVQMRVELSKLHQELRSTMIYVTHDQVEAMTLGERIVVFNGGRIEQVGTPLELYERPANLFVAGFLGSPKMNFLPCRLAGEPGDQLRLQVGNAGEWLLPRGSASTAALDGQLTLGVRPEHLEFAAPGTGLKAHLDLVEHLGDATIAYVRVDGVERELAVKLPGSVHGLQRGDPVGLVPVAGRALVFDKDGRAVPTH